MTSVARRTAGNRRLLEASYKSVLNNPNASPAEKIKAADGLGRLTTRKEKQRAARKGEARPETGSVEDIFFAIAYTQGRINPPDPRQPSAHALAAAKEFLHVNPTVDHSRLLAETELADFPAERADWNALVEELRKRGLCQ